MTMCRNTPPKKSSRQSDESIRADIARHERLYEAARDRGDDDAADLHWFASSELSRVLTERELEDARNRAAAMDLSFVRPVMDRGDSVLLDD